MHTHMSPLGCAVRARVTGQAGPHPVRPPGRPGRTPTAHTKTGALGGTNARNTRSDVSSARSLRIAATTNGSKVRGSPVPVLPSIGLGWCSTAFRPWLLRRGATPVVLFRNVCAAPRRSSTQATLLLSEIPRTASPWEVPRRIGAAFSGAPSPAQSHEMRTSSSWPLARIASQPVPRISRWRGSFSRKPLGSP